MVMEVNPELAKARSPRLVTLAGMVMEVSELVAANESFSILVSWLPSAKVTEVSEVAPLNAELPMLVTLAGMVMEVNPELAKARLPILVTPSGIVMDVIEYVL
jgi:hypothetical protein